jgi:YidC/Oxa1 family membrane protein insertase
MDRKSVLILVVCFILFMVWAQMVQRLYPPKPVPRTNAVGQSTGLLESANNAGPLTTATNAGTAAKPAGPEVLMVLTNDGARYTFTSYGGGLKTVELLKYPESVSCLGRRTVSATNRVATLNPQALQPLLALTGGEALSGDGLFQLSRISRPVGGSNAPAILAEGVRAEKALGNGLYLTKDFLLTTNYLVEFKSRLENRSSQGISLPAEQWSAGAATPMNTQDDGTLVGVHWYDGRSDTQVGRSYFEPRTLFFFRGAEKTNYAVSDKPIAWATAHNQFFFVGLIPKAPATAITATRFAIPPPTKEEVAADSRTLTNQYGYQVTLSYPATNVMAGQALEREFTVFAGPKEYRTLEKIGATLHNDLDRVMGYGGFWGFFSVVLLRSMNGLNSLGLSYGMAIIAITVIIKVLFWPLTAISTRASKRMQLLQPQMKALQERYKDDPTKMNKKLMEFMKEHKVSPMSGCWPVLLQIPVLGGFFKMVQSAIELRGASFLWACDLSKSDTIWQVPLIHFNVNPLPLLMGATMLWQARLMPPSPGMDPMQQKLMRYLPLIFLFILYNYSAGLTLYWTVQNLLSIAQLKLTRAADEKRAATVATPARPGAPVSPKKKR